MKHALNGAWSQHFMPYRERERERERFEHHLPGLVSIVGNCVLVWRVEVLFSVHDVFYEGHKMLI
jgi:hypothetical protein